MKIDDDEDVWRRVDRWDAEREQGKDLSSEDLCDDRPELIDRVRNKIRRQKELRWVEREPLVQEVGKNDEIDDDEDVWRRVDRWIAAREQGTDLSSEELCVDRPELIEFVRNKIRRQKKLRCWVEHEPLVQEVGSVEEIDELLVGTVLGDQYLVESLLAQGGQGQVYRGIDKRIRRPVAIKVAHKGRNSEQLLEEARQVAQVTHAGIVPVYHAGIHEGRFFIVSQFVEGPSLAKLMTEEKLSVNESVRIAASIADALHVAHGEGVIHRDIKPSNILVDKHRQPKITDFGIATSKEDLASGIAVATVGTLEYMAPEQLADSAMHIDRRTDIYALGVVFYELLAGSLPYAEVKTADFKKSVVLQLPKPFPEDRQIPEPLKKICLKCLENTPEKRFSTAAELAGELRRVIPTWHHQWRLVASATTAIAAAVIVTVILVPRLSYAVVKSKSSDASGATQENEPQKPETVNTVAGMQKSIFIANFSEVWIMKPEAVAILYSFDKVEWKPAKEIVRTVILCRGTIDDTRIDGRDNKFVYIKYTDNTGVQSPVYQVDVPPRSFHEKQIERATKVPVPTVTIPKIEHPFAEKPLSKSFRFDGQTRIVTPVLRTTPVTVEAWIKPDPYKSSNCQFVIGSDIPSKYGLSLGICGATLSAEYMGGMLNSEATVEPAQWSHVAAVFTESETRLYHKGKEVAKGPGGKSPSSTVFVIGCLGRHKPVEFFNGEIASIRISSGEVYKSTFAPVQKFSNDKETLLNISASSVDGKLAKDKSGKNNHGRIDYIGSTPVSLIEDLFTPIEPEQVTVGSKNYPLVFVANSDDIWVMKPDIPKIFYSLDRTNWNSVETIYNPISSSYGHTSDKRIQEHQELFVQFVDKLGNESRIYRVPTAKEH